MEVSVMTEPEDSYRDFLPRFIEAQRAFSCLSPREWALARCASEPAPDLGLVALVFGTEPALEVLLLWHNDPAVCGKHRERGDDKRPPCSDPERGAHVRGGEAGVHRVAADPVRAFGHQRGHRVVRYDCRAVTPEGRCTRSTERKSSNSEDRADGCRHRSPRQRQRQPLLQRECCRERCDEE